MRLTYKLPLAFAAALGLMLLGGLFGIFRLSQSINFYQQTVMATVEANNQAAELDSHFTGAIQEWKNVLLRGKDPKDQEKYWAAFQTQLQAVDKQVRMLNGTLPAGAPLELLKKLETNLAAAAQRYSKAFDAYKSADMDPTAGDKSARGADREPAKLIDELRSRLGKEASETAAQAAQQGLRSGNFALLAMLVALVAGMATSLWLVRSVMRQLGGEPAVATRLAKSVAQGDLSIHIDVREGDNHSLLAHLRDMQTSLASLVSMVRENAKAVEAASGEIAQGNQDLSARTEQQASALQQTAASMEELGRAVEQNASHSTQANQLAIQASIVAAKGGEVVGKVVETMEGINDSSKKIADIIGVIDGIAFQTNILALNAAVEAARAGEQGRGFAVVASEVRSLAGRSAEAAKEIKTLIGTSVQRINQGTALVNQAGVTMAELVVSIQRVTSIVGEITAASQDQSRGTVQVSQAVSQMDRVTQQNAALVEEMAAAATSLSNQARDLVHAVASFKLNPGRAGQLRAADPALDHAVNQLPLRKQLALPVLRPDRP